jgi:hypothetical protein
MEAIDANKGRSRRELQRKVNVTKSGAAVNPEIDNMHQNLQHAISPRHSKQAKHPSLILGNSMPACLA